jgi:TetR/AcrR family transcriptional regulator
LVHNYEKTDVRKRQIVEAARRLIIEKGSEHLTVKALAQAVGLTEGALYRHFPSKMAVLAFLIEEIEKALLNDIDRAGVERGSVLRTLDTLVTRHLSAVEQRRGMAFQVIAEIISLGDRDLNQQAFNTIRKYTACIEELLDDGKKAGEIKEDVDAAAAAALFFGSVQGLVGTWALANYDFDLQKSYLPVWRLLRSCLAGAERE